MVVNGQEQNGALALVGPGRAGTTVATALAARGWRVVAVAGSGPEVSPSTRAAADRLGAPIVAVEDAATDVDLVIVATPDAAIESVAARLAPGVRPDSLIIHLSGARGLDALAALPCRVGALHPLQTLPTVEAGVARLPGSWCATAGDPQVAALAAQLELRPVEVSDADRAGYHAAACIASNHLVALLAQVERVSPVPLTALLPLVQASLDNVATLGAAAALTGPVSRGDVETVRAHLEALPADERDTYRALARAAYVLSGRGAGAGDAGLAAVLQ
jgi:predicted short-subunit dehydrogenase-like oxidoreductase (DUF2520 family)